MKAVEFKARMRNRMIEVPKKLGVDLFDDQKVRVIVLLDENQEENSLNDLTKAQFLAGYADTDSIYDTY